MEYRPIHTDISLQYFLFQHQGNDHCPSHHTLQEHWSRCGNRFLSIARQQKD